ncbi:hypothetical protein [Neobacillus sp. 19]
MDGFYDYRPETPVTLEEILEIADQEMYKNKCSRASHRLDPSIKK